MKKHFETIYWTLRVYYNHFGMALEFYFANRRHKAYAYHSILCSSERPWGRLISMLKTVLKLSIRQQIEAVYYCMLCFWADYVLRTRIRTAALNDLENEIVPFYLRAVLLNKNPLDNERVRAVLLDMSEEQRMKLHNACIRWENPFASKLDCKCRYDTYFTPGWFGNQKTGLVYFKYKPEKRRLQEIIRHLVARKPDTIQDFLERAKKQKPEKTDVWLEYEKAAERLSRH